MDEDESVPPYDCFIDDYSNTVILQLSDIFEFHVHEYIEEGLTITLWELACAFDLVFLLLFIGLHLCERERCCFSPSHIWQICQETVS